MVVVVRPAGALPQRPLQRAPAWSPTAGSLGFVAKQHLAGDGIHYEPRWFKPWPRGAARRARAATARRYPLGDLVFDVRRRAASASRSARTPGSPPGPGATLARAGSTSSSTPSASHFAFGKLEVRQRFVLEGSRAFGVSYVYANLLGNEAGRAIYDGGALIASGGRLLACGPRLRASPTGSVTAAVVDVDATRMSQARTGSFAPDARGAARAARAQRRSASRRSSPRSRRASCARLGAGATRSRRRSSPAPSPSACSTTCARAGRAGFVVSL